MVETIGAFVGDYRFLSNFFRQPITWAGFVWDTNEHAFQAAKTYRRTERKKIWAARTPGEAKYLGGPRGIITLRPDWEEIKDLMMLNLLRLKFYDTPLTELLLWTDDQPLVEGNMWHDNYWGDCHCGRESCAEPGVNALGNLLMQVRREIQ